MSNVFIAPGSPFFAYNSKIKDIPNPQIKKLLRGLSPEKV
jgi:hypothetical protein